MESSTGPGISGAGGGTLSASSAADSTASSTMSQSSVVVGAGGLAGTDTSTSGNTSGASSLGGLGGAGTASSTGANAVGGAGGSGVGGIGGSGSTGVSDPGSEGDGRFELAPPYQSVNLDMRNVPHGEVYELTMASSDSTIYPGLNGPYTREVQVYIPAQYQDGVAAPFMVVQDGPSHTGRLRRALDNLISDGKVPALIAILVNHGGGDGVGSQRGLEYDTLSDTYVRFIETEVLPTVLADPNIAADYPNLELTGDPEGRAAMGCSSGAAAAFTMAWFGNDLYRRILSYSGTFVDQQDPQVPSYPNGAWEYHEHLIDDAAQKPLRVYLHVGERDLGWDANEEGLHNWVLANERMFAALSRKGYHTHFDYALASGHCDGSVMDHTLYPALEWLWRGYPVE